MMHEIVSLAVNSISFNTWFRLEHQQIDTKRSKTVTLKIIGSGFGRTGTTTLKAVLGTLGFGPTYHASGIFQNPQKIKLWKNHLDGEVVDWADVFAGYNSQVDWPGSMVWDQTFAAFPEARVIHTERPEEDWWASYAHTIGKQLRLMPSMPAPEEIRGVADVFTQLLNQNYGDFTDKAKMIAAYRTNNQKVRETIPEKQLLVLDMAKGWTPLCEFLGVSEPDTTFPHLFKRDEFWEMFGGEPIEA